MSFMARAEGSSFKTDASDFFALASQQDRCLKSGYLVKQRQEAGSWQKRFFRLVEHWPLLYYYDSHDQGKPIGVIVLKYARATIADKDDVVGVDAAKRSFGDKAKPVPLLVKTVSGIGYRLVAETPEEADAWLEAIAAVTQMHEDGLSRQLTDLNEHNRRINLRGPASEGPRGYCRCRERAPLPRHVEHLADENAKILDELNITRARLRHRDRGGSVGTDPPTEDGSLFCSWPTLACFDAPQVLWDPKADEIATV